MKFDIDSQTLNDLELLEQKYGEKSIFSFFNNCKTKEGKKIIERFFSNPLSNSAEIRARIETIKYFKNVVLLRI